MQKEIKTFLQKIYSENMQANRQRKTKLYNSMTKKFNKRKEFIYNFGIEKEYSIYNLYKLVDWYKYYLDYNLNELVYKYEIINNNKIIL